MIEIENVSVRLGGRVVLSDITATIAAGELVYLLGRNGAGKTTLLRAICGIVRPAAGRLLVNGRLLSAVNRPAVEIGVHLGVDAAHPGHTARRHLRWLAHAGGIEPTRVNAVLDAVGLADVAGRRIVDLSLGMRQRLGIAAALLGDADVIVLDEPVNGLDIDGIRWLRGLLRRLVADGRTVLVASHLFDEVARTGDRVIVIGDGRMLADAPVGEFVGAHADLERAFLAVVGRSSAEYPDAAGSRVR
ncbi:ABC transporter ATP-binding protein [Skermania piniformis]|uniref:ATP-binding cassette domain-containing protein n=1 Tax=Skermania pinensis TaxID=39122 RepID=A0ABX8SA67_9ACTN|nr:ATP-binding cassette domain-containing protein [Skermania piniformis]QXQ12616.1 ATP-binding cassette domain-containing protein [Skermania piniformis]